jgi:Gnt-I system high-affinity gluconate transporter
MGAKAKSIVALVGSPSFVMLIALLYATYTLGIRQKRPLKKIMDVYAEAIKDIAMILLIIAGSGIFKQIMEDSGVSAQLASALEQLPIHPLILGWLIAAVIRVCIGSATVAGLTAASVILPLMAQTHVNPNLMVLAVGAGSLMFSHVNDSGFWMFKEYFNLSLKDTFRTWSVMETIVSVVGIIGVMTLHFIIE